MCEEGKNSWLDHQMFLMDFPGIEKEPNFPQVETITMIMMTMMMAKMATIMDYLGIKKEPTFPHVEEYPIPSVGITHVPRCPCFIVCLRTICSCIE